MVRRASRQRSLVEVLLPDADSTLRKIDALLDDEVLVDRVTEALAPSAEPGPGPQDSQSGKDRADGPLVRSRQVSILLRVRTA